MKGSVEIESRYRYQSQVQKSEVAKEMDELEK